MLSKFTMASPDSKLIRVPIGHAIVKVGEDVIRTGTLDDIQIPSKTVWTVILDTASESLRSVDQSFDLGSQPRANPNRALRQIALSRVNIPSSSKHDGYALDLPIRIWKNVRVPEVPLKSDNVAPKKLSEFAQILGNQPQPYIQTIHAQITERTLPVIPAGVRLTGIDGDYHDPHQVFTSIEILWDTGAHSCIVVDEMLSAEFRDYLKSPIHDPYRCDSGVRVQVDASISFSNTLLKITCICLVVPRSVVPNRRVGMILGQSGAIDRIIYKSIPKANLVARGEQVRETVWGDLCLEEYVDLDGEIRKV